MYIPINDTKSKQEKKNQNFNHEALQKEDEKK